MKILIQILGPTGSGKSKLAVYLAGFFGGEIISADSAQVYKGFDIGTDKITDQMKNNIKHHLIDILEASEQFNVKQFLDLSFKAAESIAKKGKIPITCGGTALYLKSMITGIFPENEEKRISREKLKKIADKIGYEKIWNRLKKIDPVYTSKIGSNDKIRIIRGMEIYLNNRVKPSDIFKLSITPFSDYKIIRIGLKYDRERIYNNINQRVEKMFKRGLVSETVKLLSLNDRNCPPFKSIGYKEVLDFIDKKIKIDKCKELIKQHSRNFAKRQLTWFRKEKDIKWFSPDNEKEISEYLKLQIEI